MIIAAKYSFNNGESEIETKYNDLYKEVRSIIQQVKADKCKTKKSSEKTKSGKMLYSPIDLNKEFKKEFEKLNWEPYKVNCDYSESEKYYTEEYHNRNRKVKNASREMDFVKKNLGVEVQFGKYAFMVYNVCAKMTIFKNLNIIKCGIEIVPVKSFADDMSTGVSYFEQFAWDLERRGISDIDIPVLVIGVDV